MTRYMYFACCITNAAHKHSQYVVVTRDTLLKILSCLSEATCSNNCVSLFNFLTADWDCWNCHLLMCSVACCLGMKLLAIIVSKYTPDFVLFVLQFKCACKVQYALV